MCGRAPTCCRRCVRSISASRNRLEDREHRWDLRLEGPIPRAAGARIIVKGNSSQPHGSPTSSGEQRPRASIRRGYAVPVAASVRCLMRRLFPVVTEVVEQIVWVEAGDFDADEEARLAGVERLIVEVRISGAPKPENCAHGTHEGGWSPTQCRLEERDPSNRAEASAAHRFTHDDRLDVVEYDLQVGDTGGSYAAKLRALRSPRPVPLIVI